MSATNVADATKPVRRNNRITSQSYFVSRLRDCGYRTDRVYDQYAQIDSRAWTIVIDPGGASVFCTCLRGVDEPGDACIELYDAKQLVPQRFRIATDSIEVVVTYLNTLGIIRKTQTYDESGPRKRQPVVTGTAV